MQLIADAEVDADAEGEPETRSPPQLPRLQSLRRRASPKAPRPLLLRLTAPVPVSCLLLAASNRSSQARKSRRRRTLLLPAVSGREPSKKADEPSC